MSFIRTLSTVAMIVAVGLATTASASPPTAPVAVRVHLDGDTAEVTVTFLASATDLAVQVYGVDGVRVDAPRDWPRSADAGTALVRTARLTRPRAESNLVVIVDGRFAGVRRVAGWRTLGVVRRLGRLQSGAT